MSTSPKSIKFGDDDFTVQLSSGLSLIVPYTWFPRLLYASPEDRLECEFSPRGLHWLKLDEDISIDGLLAERGAPRFRSEAEVKEALRALIQSAKS